MTAIESLLGFAGRVADEHDTDAGFLVRNSDSRDSMLELAQFLKAGKDALTPAGDADVLANDEEVEEPLADEEAPAPAPLSRAERERQAVYEPPWMPTREQIADFTMEQHRRWHELGCPEAPRTPEESGRVMVGNSLTNVPESEEPEPEPEPEPVPVSFVGLTPEQIANMPMKTYVKLSAERRKLEANEPQFANLGRASSSSRTRGRPRA